jgi:RNA recognition motif-containing protein
MSKVEILKAQWYQNQLLKNNNNVNNNIHLSSDTADNVDSAQGTGQPKPHKHLRAAGGKIWVDSTLDEWPENDFRLFVGDLGKEINDATLAKAFMHYKSFAKARVVMDKKTGKTKGYGFVSFLDPFDCGDALRDMQGKYVGNRPISLRKSAHHERDFKPNQNGGKNGRNNDGSDDGATNQFRKIKKYHYM